MNLVPILGLAVFETPLGPWQGVPARKWAGMLGRSASGKTRNGIEGAHGVAGGQACESAAVGWQDIVAPACIAPFPSSVGVT